MFIRPDSSLDWMGYANCRHPENAWKFQESTLGRPLADQRAKDVCAGCAVRIECLTYALTEFNGAWGVWGGTNEAERARMKKRPA